MIYIEASKNSPKVYIDFEQLLFEISGISVLDEPLAFYQKIFKYIENDFYLVKNALFQNEKKPNLTLHFYLRYIGVQDKEMLRQIDWLFFHIKEFTTFIYWYYNPEDEDQVELANDIQSKFLNQVRLIHHSYGM
ncbi:MAG: DUF1987 domain-containing protein [Raineya sp.]|jgi:hypothetical protein|nr:DUF1987 domain-containing protein [Raineya sp.]